jgi:hypothetical protein
VLPVRYGLKLYILFRWNSVLEGLHLKCRGAETEMGTRRYPMWRRGRRRGAATRSMVLSSGTLLYRRGRGYVVVNWTFSLSQWCQSCCVSFRLRVASTLRKHISAIGYEFLGAATVNSRVTWDMTPCSPAEVHRPFGIILHIWSLQVSSIYRVIQEELPPLTELISDDILNKNVLYEPGSCTQYLQSYVRIWIFF